MQRNCRARPLCASMSYRSSRRSVRRGNEGSFRSAIENSYEYLGDKSQRNSTKISGYVQAIGKAIDGSGFHNAVELTHADGAVPPYQEHSGERSQYAPFDVPITWHACNVFAAAFARTSNTKPPHVRSRHSAGGKRRHSFHVLAPNRRMECQFDLPPNLAFWCMR